MHVLVLSRSRLTDRILDARIQGWTRERGEVASSKGLRAELGRSIRMDQPHRTQGDPRVSNDRKAVGRHRDPSLPG